MDRSREDIALAMVQGDACRIAATIRGAYEAGATITQVLTAVEVGRCLSDASAGDAAFAWQAAHDWAWIARRRGMVGAGPTHSIGGAAAAFTAALAP